MFEKIQAAPPDAILGISEAFRKDGNPRKINLSVGVYKDDAGNTPVLNCVKAAERRLIENESTKSYLGIDGIPEFGPLVQTLMLGGDHEVVASGRAATLQCPGGTGALRVAADFLAKMFPGVSIWCSEPTWPNHPGVFSAAGLTVQSYPYFNSDTNRLEFDRMADALRQIPAGDVVCLHACCHNPTGVDPTTEQWEQIAGIIGERGLLPLVDFAYQGFGDGLSEDAAGLRTLARTNRELLIASSFSKNFGLYNERIGALTVVTPDAKAAQASLSQAKAAVRANYSNPPAHGGAIVTTILRDSKLHTQWEEELTGMRNRINGMRTRFAETLAARGAKQDFSFLKRGRGMFAFSGLTPEHVDQLRERYAIYMVRNGRINIGGMSSGNVDYLCDAIASVL